MSIGDSCQSKKNSRGALTVACRALEASQVPVGYFSFGDNNLSLHR